MYKRGRIWWISVGGVRQSSGTTDRERAKTLEHKLNTEAWDRRHGLIVPSWDQACLSWMDDHPAAAGQYQNLKHSRWWKPHLTGRRLDAITPKTVHKIVSDNFDISLAEAVGPNSTANGYVCFVGRVIRHASNLNPALIHYPKSTGRDRWLTVDEWRALASVMRQDLRDIAEFALVTGLRQANCMGFTWSWIHGDTAILPRQLTKTRKPYGIPLNRTAQATLQRRRDATVRHPELVFINAGNPWYRVSLCRAIEAAVQAAGIAPITFHGLRHTFASWLAQKGVSEAIRARLGCWSTRSQADHYAHFDVTSLRPFSELFDAILAAESSHTKATA
jgi:integrase